MSRMGSSARDHFDDDDDDDVYSQPAEAGGVGSSDQNGAFATNGRPTTTPNSTGYSKPPLIPTRLKKGMSLGSSPGTGASGNVIVDTEYIVMPPSRLREMVDTQNNHVMLTTSVTSPPTIPPKPSSGVNGARLSNGESTTSSSPPPPLLPR